MNPLYNSNEADRDKLLNLLAERAYINGDFQLSSGKRSHHYVNCKPVSLSGIGLSLLSRLLLEEVDKDSHTVAGLTLGADPLVSGVALTGSVSERPIDALIVRKEPKGHGTSAWLEGPLPPKGSLVTVLEDVVTTGDSSLKAVNKLQEAGFVVNKIVSIVDRQEGGSANIQKAGLKLVSLYMLEQIAKRSKEISK